MLLRVVAAALIMITAFLIRIFFGFVLKLLGGVTALQACQLSYHAGDVEERQEKKRKEGR